MLASQPWLRMTFCDNSDFAPLVPLRDGDKVTEMEEIARGEDFVQAGVSCEPLRPVRATLTRRRRWRWVSKR